MKWKITRDVHPISGMNRVGYGNYDGDAQDLPFEFRLLDDDNDVYFHGRSDDCDSEEAFDPLDWAMSDSGCTKIQYYENGAWQTL